MSRWVRGTRAPVDRELDVDTPLPVEGRMPPLNGMLVRMSVNPIGLVPADHHWFEGPGMVHAIELADGVPVRFANRWVRTPAVSRALGEEPVLADLGRSELANTSALMVRGRLLAMTETCTPIELDRDLRTVERAALGGVAHHFTAHPHDDPHTGETFGVGYEVNDDPACTVVRCSPDGQASTHRVELLGPRSIHDFAMTARHLVVWDLPLDLRKGVDGSMFAYRWRHESPARLGLIDRDHLDTPPQWFDIEPCWVFHPLNAWEDTTSDGAGCTIVDVCRFDRIFDIDLTGPGDPTPPQLWRWEIDHRSGRVRETLIDERIQEFPRIDSRQWSRRHEMGYTIELFNAAGTQSVLAHHVDRGVVDSWSSPPGTVLSEAVGVPGADRTGAQWLLTIESTTKHSSLVVLDADALHDGPVARVALPQRIPDGFHGDWIPA
jgi:carotenoid cleavage dioxygenase-like enzyme